MTVKTITRKKYKIDQTCPVCGEPFSSQGLRLHLQAAHSIHIPAGTTLKEFLAQVPISSKENTPDDVFTGVGKPGVDGYSMLGPRGGPSVPGELQNVSQLRKQVEVLELEQKKSRLMAGHADARMPDLAEQSGLGSMTDDVKQIVQGRAFNVQQQAASQEDGILKVLEVISQIKGLFGGDNSSRDNGLISTIEAIGRIKELFGGNSNPGAITPGNFQVDNIPLGGLGPEGIVAVLSYLEKKETAKIKAESDQEFRNTIAGFVEKLGQHLPELANGVKGSLGAGGRIGRRQVSDKPLPVTGSSEDGEIICPICGDLVEIAKDATEIACRCGQKFTIERGQAGEPEPNEPTFTCATCKHTTYLNALGLPDESGFTCPKCSQHYTDTIGELKQQFLEEAQQQ